MLYQVKIFRLRCLLGFLSLIPVLMLPVAAQLDRATLTGTITDPSGAVVSDVNLELVSQDTGLRREAVSSASGAYTFSMVPIGTYNLTVNHSGFKTANVKDIKLGVGDNTTVNIPLEIKTSDVSVTVESVLVPLEKTSAVVGTVIGDQQIKDIPVNGRHWASLMALAREPSTPATAASRPYASWAGRATTTTGRWTAWTPPGSRTRARSPPCAW